jgi:hypothetical protein
MEPRKHKFIIETFDHGHQDQSAKRHDDLAGYDHALARTIVQIDFNVGCG